MRPACGPIPEGADPDGADPDGADRVKRPTDTGRYIAAGVGPTGWRAAASTCKQLSSRAGWIRYEPLSAVSSAGRRSRATASVFSAPDALDALECRAVLQAGLGQPGVKRLMVGWLRATVACFRQRAARAGLVDERNLPRATSAQSSSPGCSPLLVKTRNEPAPAVSGKATIWRVA